MLIEAGVHYSEATGDDRLLKVATRMADYMVRTMGPAPKKEYRPAHSGPEEALVKLYKLYRDPPGLRAQTGRSPQPATTSGWPSSGSATAACHCGYPLWGTWGQRQRGAVDHEELYTTEFGPKHGPHGAITRRTRSAYSTSRHRRARREGHPAGECIAAARYENGNADYIATAKLGGRHGREKKSSSRAVSGQCISTKKFGHDYYLPTDAYLETCAAVGVGFFSQAMNQLTGDANNG